MAAKRAPTATLLDLFEDSAVVVLSGPAGIGKTWQARSLGWPEVDADSFLRARPDRGDLLIDGADLRLDEVLKACREWTASGEHRALVTCRARPPQSLGESWQA